MCQGRLVLLLGPPGSGKSTLLKALSGKLRKDPDLKVGSSPSPLLALLGTCAATMPGASLLMGSHDAHGRGMKAWIKV